MFDISELPKALKKHIARRDVLILFGLVLLYFLIRIINITKFPIFSDEGIYINWANTAWHDATWRFISLTDGKQPLQTWGTIPFLKLFPDNLLLGARLYATMNGLLCLLGIISVTNYLFGKKAAIWGGVLYIFTPYFLFYDRMALVDSGVNAAAVWILFFSIWLVQKRRLDIAFLFGFVAGFGLLAKSSVEIFLGSSVFAPILILQKKLKNFFPQAISYYILFAVTVVISVLIYNVQRLSPYMHMVTEKNATFVMPLHDFIHTPFLYFFRNIQLIPWYVFQESGYILPLLGIIGLILLFRNNKQIATYLLVWLLIPFFIVAFLSIIIYPRYLIFMPSFLSILAAYLFSILKDKRKVIILALAFFISVLYFDYTILFKPQNIPFPPIDRSQYLEDWSAGWGVREIVDFVRQKSLEKPVIVVAEGNFGMATDSLTSLLKRQDQGRISVWGRWPLKKEDLTAAQKELKDKYVYVVFAHTNNVPIDWPLKLIQTYKKPGNKSVVYLFELLPQ